LQWKLQGLKWLAKERGIEFIVTSTLRTEDGQIALFAQGRKPLNVVNELRKDAGLRQISEDENKRKVTYSLASTHLFGCAFDAAIVNPARYANGNNPPQPPFSKGGQGLDCKEERGGLLWDVKADINKNDIPDYEELGALGESIGLKWGGRFRFKDYCHFEWTGGLTIEELKAGKRPEEKNV
jgi:peptidoglycan L-alanyl-D-glutamate endopeptidase CwlK